MALEMATRPVTVINLQPKPVCGATENGYAPNAGGIDMNELHPNGIDAGYEESRRNWNGGTSMTAQEAGRWHENISTV